MQDRYSTILLLQCFKNGITRRSFLYIYFVIVLWKHNNSLFVFELISFAGKYSILMNWVAPGSW